MFVVAHTLPEREMPVREGNPLASLLERVDQGLMLTTVIVPLRSECIVPWMVVGGRVCDVSKDDVQVCMSVFHKALVDRVLCRKKPSVISVDLP